MAQKMVRLVSLEVCTPYKAGEVATFPENVAEQLLHRNMEKTDFGVRYERVKWRLFREGQDEDLLLVNRSLTQPEHNDLLSKLHPEKLDKEGNEILDKEYRRVETDDFDNEDGATSEVEAATRKARRQ